MSEITAEVIQEAANVAKETVVAPTANPTPTPEGTVQSDAPLENTDQVTINSEVELPSMEVEPPVSEQPSFEFANPLVKDINDMFGRGANFEEVERFIKIQKLDFTQVGESDIIKQKMMMDNPELSAGHIDALFDHNYGEVYPVATDEDGNEGPADKARYNREVKLREARLMQDSKKSKEYLKSLVKDLGQGERQEQRNQENMRRAQLESGWKGYASQIIPNLNLNTEFESKDGEKYSFQFKPTISEEDAASLSQIIATHAAEAGLQFNKQDAIKLQDIARAVVANSFLPQYKEALARDAYARGREKGIRESSGNGNIPRGSNEADRAKSKNPYPKVRSGYI